MLAGTLVIVAGGLFALWLAIERVYSDKHD